MSVPNDALLLYGVGCRAKNIRNRPEVNQKISKTAMIKEMSSEMEKLRMELISQREKNGVFMPTEKYQAVSSSW